jgi:REP-associated tyrosine transposase
MAKQYNKQNGRKNMRLPAYDYSCAGLFFITIAVQNRLHLFGNVQNGKMDLNHAGQMIEKWYYEIENKFPDKHCHHMVVMPNHFHCIIENATMDAHVGAPLRGRPNDENRPNNENHSENQNHPNDEKYGMQNRKYGATIGWVMDWFKTMTTNAYIRGVKNNHWQTFDRKLWQRNYYDHIIRNEQSFQNISEYIINNPVKWNDDKFYDNNNIK